MHLRDFSTLTFDCYGTLIDWETGILENLRSLAAEATYALSDDEILEAHARHEHRLQMQTPERLYPELLADVYASLAEEWGVSTGPEKSRTYGASVGTWPAFGDSVQALAYLKEYYRLVILSNVDRGSFAISNEQLGVVFDAIYTAEDVGAYKPSDRNFRYLLNALAKMGVGKEEILHTAESMFHDHEPANRHGLASCFIYRRHDRSGFGATKRPEVLPSYAFRYNSLAEMVEAHQQECRE